MGEEYLILESKIFYLQRDKQIVNGIMDMEKLNQTDKVQDDTNKGEQIISEQFQLGPFAVDGNNEFAVIFKESKSFRVRARFYQEPNSYQISLLADYENKCKFSTFLNSGEILVKIMDRYMMFEPEGKFIYQVTFGDIDKEKQFKELEDYNKIKDIKNKDPLKT